MSDQLADAISAEKSYRFAEQKSQMNCFAEFARKQPEAINDLLFKINDQIKQIDSFNKDSYESLIKLKAELEKMRPINDEIKAKRANHKKAQDVSAKSISNAEKSEARLNAAKAKTTPEPEIKKLEDNLDACIRQKQTDLATLEESSKQIEIDNKEYKKKLFQSYAESIIGFCSQRGSSCSSKVSYGEKIEGFGNQLPFYEDSSIDSLQARLQQLRSEPIE